MRKASKTVAAWFGIVAGVAGIEHGYFEILQGDVRPKGLMIVSIGPPCAPEEAWNACEPAMTVIPNFLITGTSWRSFLDRSCSFGRRDFWSEKRGAWF